MRSLGCFWLRLGVCLCLAWLSTSCERKAVDNELNVQDALGGIAAEGFQRAIEPRAFRFPGDHQSHPDFRNEWWYITGNLESVSGQRLAYQVTFFRIALSPEAPDNISPWASNQLWMAHVALTDIDGQQHLHDQRLARGAVGLAGQAMQPFRVWLEDWQIIGQPQGEFPWQVQVETAGFQLDLQIKPLKPVVLQGEQGLSRKSSEPGNASYYYSFTRLETLGEIHYGGERFAVRGLSWLDREWSTSVLGADQVGWDWFSLQLTDGNDVMFYRMRAQSGKADVHSVGKWVAADGKAQALTLRQVDLKPLRYWQDAQGHLYPVEWEMHIPGKQRHWQVKAVLDDQQMLTGITYWEGAVTVTDLKSRQLVGRGYLEMSGY